MLYLCVNAQKHRTTIKFRDIKVIKMDRIWNQLSQKTIIVEMRLRRFMQDGEKNYCKNTSYRQKQTVKFSNSWLGYNVWSSAKLKKCVKEVE